MPTRYILIGLAAAIALTLSVVEYQAELRGIRQAAEQAVQVRANLINRYIILMRQNVYALDSTIEDRYLEARRTGSLARELESIRPFVDYDVWGVSGAAGEGGIESLSGTLTGTSVLARRPPELDYELTAVFSAESQFRTLLEHVPEVIWVYYTSLSEFIYIAPDPAVADFRFSDVLYTKEFWSQAEPSVNPEGRQIISDLYDDAYGQGLMISLSSPVVVDGRFLGIASLDLGLGLLRGATGFGEALGESILIDENNRIVARRADFELGETYDVDHREDAWIIDADGTRWRSAIVARDELRLLHRLPRSTLYWNGVRESLLVWAVLFAMLVLVAFSVRLREALAKVTTLMNRDDLTGLLNRRGIQEAYRPLRELALREGRDSALLLLDIDHFKHINDSHGHEVGDQVLSTIADRLQAHVREYDLVCRWGGEEILVFLANGDAEVYRAIAERLRQAVDARPMSSANVQVSVSGGLTLFASDESLVKNLQRADRLLYQAKDSGRNRIVSDLPDV
ncbi:sensor domain-containing diguanylate cyclase [Saccharospirillum salsuginis]|uniref:diguanylate cyclase n=1 Tax=Saccharospirillum salsuginis TaxID=418750 RepID=A0A918NJC3_9GAMM|nr:sensor domain-containing diguanylate cyclase [Saccharospirillum salsuginis]GGX72035.1 sensor domain-containing diguanylate cyclase [Saccharospirillum salsuginis]